MNHCVPDWNMEDHSRSLHDLLPPKPNQKKPTAPENELVELLWRNGHVVMQSQSNRKPPPVITESRQETKLDPSVKYGGSVGNSSNLILEDGLSSWFQYPVDDPLDRELSEFFTGVPGVDTIDTNQPNKDVFEQGQRYVKFGVAEESNSFHMPPPKFGSTKKAPGQGNSSFVNLLSNQRPPVDDVGLGSGVVGGIGESSSARTVGSSACGSNQADRSYSLSNGATHIRGRGTKDVHMSPLHKRVQTNTFDPTGTSSSGGSGCSFGRTVGQQNASNRTHKRKGRDGEDFESHSEEAEYESMDGNRPAQQSGSTRKSRAAEVHNLSERRRRDRINEKMKALQELIPHCNKSDKASMLDEAIGYLKSLQLQLQIMWMGSGMAPMMFPGVQQYMSRVGIGMGHASMPSINNPIQSPVLNPMNFPTHMQNVHLPESYQHYVGFPHMQLSPQAMNLYAYGPHMVQQNQTAAAVAAAGSSSLPTAGIPSEKIQNGQSG